MPIAEISGASLNEPRSGLYASRSIVQFQTEVSAMPATKTRTKVSGRKVSPMTLVKRRKTSSAMNADSMNTSPWAKFTMPMMPKTMV